MDQARSCRNQDTSGLSFPLMMGGSVTPRPLLNGQVDAASRSSDRSTATWEPMEALALQHQSLLQDRVRTLLDDGRRGDAARAIDEWVMATSAAHLAVLGPGDTNVTDFTGERGR